MGDDELDEIRQVLASGWISTGPKTRQFEEEFAQAVGARYAVAVNSCTAAMHLALEAIGLKAGDEVITTPYTFAATAEVIRYFGARPVFVDIDPVTLNMDAGRIAGAVTGRTRAVIPVHIAGLPVDLQAVSEAARNAGLEVIEDAAHAFPSKYQGRMVGSSSLATCFSFYATKTLTTAEGGMLCTDSEKVAERCRVMSLHGISKDAWKRYAAEGSWFYEIVAPGFKYNMTDVAAAMGLAQLRKAWAMWERRTAIAERYTTTFRELAELQVPAVRDDCQHSWHLYMLRLNLDRLRIDRNRFIEELKRRNIGASVHFVPLHVHPYYRETFGYQASDFPVAFRESAREISLPIYSRMSNSDVEDVIDAVYDIIATSRA
ncbi:MAG TPA: DegT/DnrJ/EryC1/StrS family aminotransferase [Bacteroidota bacterium]